MKKTIISILSLFVFINVISAQAIEIQLIDKSIAGNTWTFTVQATALPSYTNDLDNWSAMNVRYDLLLPPGTTVTTPTGTSLTGIPAGMTATFQPSVPGSPTTQNPSYNAEFGLFFDRGSATDLQIGIPQIWGSLTVTFSMPVSIPANTYDQRDVTSGTGSFYVTGDDPGTQRAIASGAQQALPIKLRNFTVGKFGNERIADLNWTSSSEVNSNYFDIERSEDGFSFVKIGNQKAAGNSSVEQFYNMLDRSLPNSRGSNDVFYYRLKMVDLDGKYEYSEVRSIRFDNENNIEVLAYPNPTSGKVFVNISTPDFDKSLTTDVFIYDLSGKLVMKTPASTKGITQIDLDNITNGAYDIQVSYNGKSYQNRIIKTN